MYCFFMSRYIANDKSNLYQHIRREHLEKNIKCEECNFVTDCKDSLKRHVQTKHTLKKCEECEFVTNRTYSLKRHIQTRHAMYDVIDPEYVRNHIIYPVL